MVGADRGYLFDQPQQKSLTLSLQWASLGRNTAHMLMYFTAGEGSMLHVTSPGGRERTQEARARNSPDAA